MKIYVEERASIGDNSGFRRELVVRASLEDDEAKDLDAIARTVEAAKEQTTLWEAEMRTLHYKGVRRGMIANMLQGIIDGQVEPDELVDVVIKNTSEILEPVELEVIKREIAFAAQLTEVRKRQESADEDDAVELPKVSVQAQYGRRRRF